MKGRQRSMAIRSGINKQGWEKSDFPVACNKCYGENPYMRMLREDYGQQCRLCFRPFTVFKWKGDRGVYKRTHICQGCSKERNLCQVCTLDLQFGLPMQVRDKRCGKNGKLLLNQKFVSQENQKFKPAPPPGPPPSIKQNPTEKQLVFIPERQQEGEDGQQINEEQNRVRVKVLGKDDEQKGVDEFAKIVGEKELNQQEKEQLRMILEREKNEGMVEVKKTDKN